MKSVIALLGLMIAQIASAETEPCRAATGQSVIVNGAATVSLTPDRVSFSVGIETEAATVSEAFQRNTAKANALIAALKKRGVLSSEIQTVDLTITSRDEEMKKLSGYRVINTITVSRGELSSIGDLLQIAVENGANEVGSLNFSVRDETQARKKGLELAFMNAKEKATQLAALSGKSLGGVVCVAEGGYSTSVGSIYPETITVTAASPAIEVGLQPLSFTVGAVFELK